MAKRRTSHEVFIARTYSVYRHQVERLGELSYTLEDIRDIVSEALKGGLCPFCMERLTASNFSVDHDIPVSRDGSLELHNLRVICDPCNRTKGPLTGVEYWSFLKWADENLQLAQKKWMMGRIKAGGNVFGRFKRKRK